MTGLPIPLKSALKSVPVLRRMVKHRITNEPVQTVDIHPQIRRLGRFCDFKGRSA
ncbi:hypothetical protein QBC45DRAFT_425422 [Copromyces sp. CBS 386.78]|nr:hypothetical protein QBC45DRAFT_425422 [Copromyces sp. CBS 386.78]